MREKLKLSEVIGAQRIVAIYGGRFQPAGSHHIKTYQYLVNKFGRNNVFIATSDVTGDKSPFTFAEKKKILTAYGVPSSKIVKTKSPYRADEIKKKLSPTDVVVFGFGEKDAGRLVAGKYFNPWKPNQKKYEPHDKAGYIFTLPHVSLKVGGKEMSGTSIRAALGDPKKSSDQKKNIFKKIFGFYSPDIFKLVTNKLSEGVNDEGVLLEGGASGHMSHPWENIGMTFGELKRMVIALLSGSMDVEKISEKTDGQNLNITYHDGQVVASRNKGQSKNFGANGLTIGAIKKMFAGRGELSKAFISAMTDLQLSISSLTEKQRLLIFDNGRNWINLEIIYQPTRNVIPYNVDLLQFHGINKFDKEGNKVGQSPKEGKILAGMIKQINQDKQETFDIRGPQSIVLPKARDFSVKKDYYIKQITNLQNKYSLKNSDSLLQYHRKYWQKTIGKESKSNKVKLSREMKNALVRRFAQGDKSFALSKKNIKDDKIYDFVKKLDKVDGKALFSKNIQPFEDIFLSLGAEVLENVQNFIAVSPDKGVKDIKKDLTQTISSLRKGGDPNKLRQLNTQLRKIKRVGGFDKIVPSEGIVFDYKGNTYKLTGVFAPINQILGMSKFD